jgi:hypothetical protein
VNIHQLICLGARQGAAFVLLFTIIFVLPALAGAITGY